jgi:UDP-N-acetylmuramoyl-tripeptide--D-alanyl-D-alanine ligase
MLDYTSVEKLYDYFISADQLVSTDTRNLEPGAIFFALKGENFNANKFAQQAIDSGCSYAVVDEAEYAIKPNIVLVENVLKSLQLLANFHRNRLNIPVLAITGSNAKTTHKELIHAVLSKKFKTAATIGNLNNHIGVPLTLLNIRPDHEFAIIEMGANHQGEIADLCKIVNPDFGLITNIGKAHLEGFGGIEGVKKGKSELYKFLKAKNCKTFISDIRIQDWVS